MYIINGTAYNSYGQRIQNYRHEGDMIAAELAAKAHGILSRAFRAEVEGREKAAAKLFQYAESLYAKAVNAKY